MSTDRTLLIPITGSHVREALEVARQDQDAFRQAEMNWLGDHSGLVKLYVQDIFDQMISLRGIDEASGLLLGALFGHFAVRDCMNNDQEMYADALNNFRHNRAADLARLRQPSDRPTLPTDNEESIRHILGNEELVSELLLIKHPVARDAASVMIAYFSLAELPDPLPATEPTSL